MGVTFQTYTDIAEQCISFPACIIIQDALSFTGYPEASSKFIIQEVFVDNSRKQWLVKDLCTFISIISRDPKIGQGPCRSCLSKL